MMHTKKTRILFGATLLLTVLLFTAARAEEKKIDLDDIERDNLKSERGKDEEDDESEDEQQQLQQQQHHHQQQQQQQHEHHQYDVEEVNEYPQNAVEHPYHMQIIYVPQYESTSGGGGGGDDSAYHIPSLYYETTPPSGDAGVQHHQQNYITLPVAVTAMQGYILPYVPHHPPPTYHPQLEHIKIPSPYHIPQVVPQYAHEISRPVYSHISGNLAATSYLKAYQQSRFRPQHKYTNTILDPYNLGYGLFTKRKPSSLLESYIPSSIQIEYLKRGLSKEPLSTYDTIARTKGYPVKNFETGFVPNGMYPTAGGGVAYGSFHKRSGRK